MSEETSEFFILMRHAKSDWHGDAETDFERPLNARGRRDAPRMAAHLAEQGYAPRVVLCSPAARTRETLDLMCAVEGWDAVEAEFVPELYAADVRRIMAEAARRSRRGGLMILAHNPGLSMALLEYCPQAAERAGDKLMPTATAAVLDAPTPGAARLLALARPAEV